MVIIIFVAIVSIIINVLLIKKNNASRKKYEISMANASKVHASEISNIHNKTETKIKEIQMHSDDEIKKIAMLLMLK